MNFTEHRVEMLKQQIKIMEAFLADKLVGCISRRALIDHNSKHELITNPNWNWNDFDYKVL